MSKYLRVTAKILLVLQCLVLISGSVYLMLTGENVSDAFLVVACLIASSFGLAKICED